MSITVVLPRALLPYARGSTELVCDTPCKTVHEALAAVTAQHPALLDRVLNERGELRPHVNVFVGEENIRFLGGLSAAVPDGATLLIVPAVSGG